MRVDYEASFKSLARRFDGKEKNCLGILHVYSKDPGRTIAIVRIRIVTGRIVMIRPTNNNHNNSNCTNKIVAIIHN